MNDCVKMKQHRIDDTAVVLLNCIFRVLWIAILVSIIMPSSGFSLPADTVEVKPLNTQPGAASLYILNFSLSDTLPSDAIIEVSFPEGFDLSKVGIAGSSTINGGFSVSVAGQNVYVKRKGKGSIKLPGDRVDVKFSTVVNPPDSDSNHLILVRIKKKNENKPTEELKGFLAISGKKSLK